MIWLLYQRRPFSVLLILGLAQYYVFPISHLISPRSSDNFEQALIPHSTCLIVWKTLPRHQTTEEGKGTTTGYVGNKLLSPPPPPPPPPPPSAAAQVVLAQLHITVPLTLPPRDQIRPTDPAQKQQGPPDVAHIEPRGKWARLMIKKKRNKSPRRKKRLRFIR